MSHPARTTSTTIQATKKDKRDARHTALLSKVESSAAVTKASKKNFKRSLARATAQNLSTNLHSLADALPDTNDPLKEFLVAEGLDQKPKVGAGEAQPAKIKMKTLKSKPGAQKRKEKILKEECTRFVQNLAIIQTAVTQQPAQSLTSSSPAPAPSVWSALRSHIANSMEKKEDFVKMDAAAKVASENCMVVD